MSCSYFQEVLEDTGATRKFFVLLALGCVLNLVLCLGFGSIIVLIAFPLSPHPHDLGPSVQSTAKGKSNLNSLLSTQTTPKNLPVAPVMYISGTVQFFDTTDHLTIKKESDTNPMNWKGKQTESHFSSRSELFFTPFLHFDEEYTETIESFAPAAKTDL